MARNEHTSPRIAKTAGHLLAMPGRRGSRVRLFFDVGRGSVQELDMPLADLRALAASALTQTADKGKWRQTVDEEWQALADHANDKRRFDDRGFDPRDGGRVGKQHVPKRKSVLSARIKSARSNPWPPSAKPPKRGP